MRYHSATEVYRKFSIISIAFIFAITSVTGTALSVAISGIASAAGAPSIVSVDSYYVKGTYKGVATDIKVDGLTDVSNVEVQVNRSGGATPITKTSKAPVNTTLSTGTVATTTAPIIIQHGTYSEAGSSSWNPASAWASASTPVSVTVTITYAGGATLTKTDDTISENLALLSEVMPATPDIHSLRYTTVNGSYKGIVIDQYVRNFSDATSYKATIHRADGSSVSRTGNVDVLNIINSGGNKSLTTPFNFAGNTDGSTYGAQSAVWTPATKPVGVTIEIVTTSYGTIVLSTPPSQTLIEGASKLYENIIPNYPPATTLNVEGLNNGLVGNTFTVSGDASAVYGLNRVYVQLVHRETSTRYGGTTINLLPNGTNAHWSQTYDATKLNLPEGTYAAHVSVIDKRGVSDSVGWTDNFKLDKTSPTFAIVTPMNNSTVNGTQRISATVTDANNIQKLLMNVGDGHGNYTWVAGKTSKITRVGDTFYIDIDTNTLPNGVNYVVLRATDGAGNTRYYNNNAATRAHSYKVDNAAPEVAIVSPANDSHHNGSVEIRGKVQDNEDNLRHYYVNIARQNSNNTWNTIYSKTTVTNQGFDNKALYTLPDSAAEGRYRVQLSARDSVGGGSDTGNRSNDIYTYFVVDKTSPTASSLATDRTLYGGTYNTIQATGTVNDENIASYRFSIDGTSISSGWTATASGNVAASLGIPSISGTYTIRLEAQDKAGNTQSTTTAIFVDIDAVLTISGINDGNTLSGFRTMTASLEEDGTVDNFTFKDEDGDIVTVNGTSATPNPGQRSFRFNTTQLVNGEYTVTITGRDALGNSADPRTITFEVFNTPLAPNANGPTSGAPITLTAAPPIPAGLAANQFNTNNPQVLGISIDQEAANNQSGTGNTNGKVKASSTKNNEKELVESTSSNFAWYWIPVLIAMLVAIYYGYRNWKLNKENA